MLGKHFVAVLADINNELDGGGFSLNLGLKSGIILSDVEISQVDRLIELVCVTKADHPVLYVDLADIEFVQLSTGAVGDVPSRNRGFAV